MPEPDHRNTMRPFHLPACSLVLTLAAAPSLMADTLFSEDFESPDVSSNSTFQYGATFNQGSVPDNGNWVGSSQGFGANRFGLIHKVHGDYSAPSGNEQGMYFGYTNSGLTTSTSALTSVLEEGAEYTLEFDVARDNDSLESTYIMQLVAFASEEDDASRTDVRPGSRPGVVLASVSGTVTSNDLSEHVVLTFVPDAIDHAAEMGKTLGVRFLGNSSHPILDNVLLTSSGSSGPVDPDSDADGLPDAWEIANFGDLSHDGTADSDGDGLSDAFEYSVGLDPMDPDTDGDGLADWVGYLESENQVILILEDFEVPDVSASSTTQDGATYDKGALPGSGNWIGSATGFGSDRKGLIHKTHVDFAAAAGNSQAFYFGYTNTGLTSSVAATEHQLKMGVIYTLSFDVARDNDKTESTYLMELVAFDALDDDAARVNATGTRPGTVLASANGSVMTNDLSERVTIAFEPDPALNISDVGKTVGVRFVGNSSHPIIDNIKLTALDTDSDSDGLDDDWEMTYFGDLSKDGTEDSDNDTLLDLFEYQVGLDPTSDDTDGDGNKDWVGIPGHLTVEYWDNIPGVSLVDLFSNPSFYNASDWGYYTPRAEAASNAGDNYGLRMSGRIIAPRTGEYRFWVAGDEACKLYLSTDASIFNRREIASVELPVDPENWDAYPSQKSRIIHLDEGQEYYIEVFMKEGAGDDHAAVAWEYPEQAREIIPGIGLRSFVPDPGDLDDDGMLDTWESQVGLDPDDNGSIDLNQSGYLDADGDGLLNFEEYLYGGNPFQAGGNKGFLELNLWTGLTGSSVLDLVQSPDYALAADVSGWTGAETSGWGGHYGGRLRGTVTPPESGDYHFYVAGDDAAELWLSTGNDRFDKQKVAWNRSRTDSQEWNKFPTQKSSAIPLVAGQPYYIEALVKNQTNADHLSIGWAKVNPVTAAWSVQDAGLPIPATWTENGATVAVTSYGGEIWNYADTFTYRYLQLTGDCVLTTRVASIDAVNEWAKVGLMVRESLDAGSRNYMVLRTGEGRLVYQSRGANDGLTLSSYRSEPENPDVWIRIERAGDQILAYSSEDGEKWKQFARSGTNVGQTIYIGMAVSGLNGGQVDATLDEVSLINTSDIELVPSSALTSITPHANDQDDDSLPDDWEQTMGLDATTAANGMGQYGDPDGDRVDNLQEYQMGGHPLQSDGVQGSLTRELWTSHPTPDIYNFVRSPEFLAGPNQVDLLPTAEFQRVDESQKFGQRIRGSVVAPVSGAYRFWIAGEKDYELWLSSDSTKFNKQKIASSLQWEDGADARSVSFRDWDKFSSQMSRPVELVEGNQYFIEILHKDVLGDGHFSVAWSHTDAVTGETSERGVIPSSQLRTFTQSADDADDDYLPDSWETEVGLSITDNGLSDSKQGEYGDHDGDHLSNREEWLLGTNPVLSDTDGDGISDYDEANIYFSDPTASDALQEQVVSTVALTSVADFGSKWNSTESGGVEMASFRGEGVWQFSVPSDGYWVIRVDTRLLGDLQDDEVMPVHVKINGTYLKLGEILYKDGDVGFLRVLTPYLAAGSHELELFFDNYMARRQVEVTGISVLALSGVDEDGNGIPDLLEKQLKEQNSLAEDVQVISHVSPVFIEGFRRSTDMFELRSLELGPGSSIRHKDAFWNRKIPEIMVEIETLASAITSQPGNDRTSAGEIQSTLPGPGRNSWFANLELDQNQATAYTAFFEGGISAESGVVVWRPLNLVENGEITIPVGSELLMGAWETETDNSTLNFTINGVAQPEIKAHDSVVHLFDTVGSFTVTVLHGKSGVTYELNVHVETADFPGGLHLGESRTRLVQLPGVEPHLTPDSGGEILMDALRPADEGGSEILMSGLFPGIHRTAVRINESGPILDVEEVNVVGVSDSLRNDADRAVSASSGLVEIESPLLITNLPEGGYVLIKIFRAGVTFLDGSTVLKLTAADFNEYGVALLRFYFPTNMEGGFCHYVDVYDADDNLVYHGL